MLSHINDNRDEYKNEKVYARDFMNKFRCALLIFLLYLYFNIYVGDNSIQRSMNDAISRSECEISEEVAFVQISWNVCQLCNVFYSTMHLELINCDHIQITTFILTCLISYMLCHVCKFN